MVEKTDCIFCGIVNRTEPAEIIFENDDLICFLDLYPINYGHLLLVPKTHYCDLKDLPDELASKIIIASKKMGSLLDNVYKPDGINVFQSNGIFNETGHYHMHLVPRYMNDGFGFKYPDIKRNESLLRVEGERIKYFIKLLLI